MSSRKNITLPNFNILVLLLAAFLLWAGGIATAHAAVLGISPYSETVAAGKTITVRVTVNSQGQSINAVSGGVTFSSDLLTLTSISKTNSIVSLWAQAPTYSNDSGTASFQGVILNGYSGIGTILTLSFKTKAAGVATIGISSGSSSVLLNDGNGTNVLTGTASDTVTITKAPIIQPVQPSNPAVIPTVPAIVPARAALPVVTDYQSPLLSNNFVVAKGTADPDSVLTATLSHTSAKGTATAFQTLVTVANNGTFTYVSDKKVSVGTYTLVFTTSNAYSTNPITIIVKNPLSFVIVSWLASIVSIKIALFWVVLLLLLCIYLWHRNRVLRRHLQDALDKIHTLEQK